MNQRNNVTNKDLSSLTLELAPADYFDQVIEAYKKDVDRTLLRANLRLTVDQRLRKAESFHASLDGWRGAANRARSHPTRESQR
jgi:hypothetical protein